METILNIGREFGGKVWLKTSALPALFFLAGISALYIDLKIGWEAFWNQVHTLPGDIQLVLLLSGAILIVIGATVLEVVGLDLLRWAEGYWYDIWILRWFFEPLRRRYQKTILKAQQLFSDLGLKREAGRAAPADLLTLRQLDQKLHYYPANPDEVMPTLLGNILRSVEEHVRVRYGLDPVVTWLPLYPHLNASLQSALENSRATLDLAVRLMFLTILLTFISTPLRWAYFGWLHGIGTLGVGCVVFLILYRWAIQAAKVYGEFVRTAFDLHRFDLYQALHFQLPARSGEEEQKLGRQLSEFLWRGQVGAADVSYQHPGRNEGNDHENSTHP